MIATARLVLRDGRDDGACRSRRLMTRLGMARRPDLDFAHPGLAPDDPLRPHIVYASERA